MTDILNIEVLRKWYNTQGLGLGRYCVRAKATGIEVNVPFAHLWKVSNGQIVWARQYTDTLLLAQALQA